MTKEFVCIVCPNGCTLQVAEENGEITVTGNKCKRGEAFAKTELTSPMRTICSTVATSFPGCPVLPVRVSAEIPKSSIADVMKEINKVTVSSRIARGDKVIENVLGLGVDIIATSSVLKKGDKI